MLPNRWALGDRCRQTESRHVDMPVTGAMRRRSDESRQEWMPAPQQRQRCVVHHDAGGRPHAAPVPPPAMYRADTSGSRPASIALQNASAAARSESDRLGLIRSRTYWVAASARVVSSASVGREPASRATNSRIDVPRSKAIRARRSRTRESTLIVVSTGRSIPAEYSTRSRGALALSDH
jgi:hypothetical protein